MGHREFKIPEPHVTVPRRDSTQSSLGKNFDLKQSTMAWLANVQFEQQ